VSAYSFLIDEGRWDEWFALFSDDILFETTTPCFGTIRDIPGIEFIPDDRPECT